MAMLKITLRHLEFLHALIDTGHFGKAADRMNVTQPALSLKIKELEDHFGAPLIDRAQRPYKPTSFGYDIWQSSQVILADMHALEQMAQRRRGTQGPLRIGMIPTIAPYLLPQALKHTGRDLPNLELHLREAQTEHLLEELDAGILDACVIATPVDHGQYAEFPLIADRFVLAIDKDTAKRAGLKNGHVTLADLLTLRLLLLEDGHCLREQTMQFCQITPKDTLRRLGASSLQTLARLVAHGHGATLLPELSLETAASEHLTLLRLTGPEPERDLRLICRRAMEQALDLGALAATLRKAAHETIRANAKLIG